MAQTRLSSSRDPQSPVGCIIKDPRLNEVGMRETCSLRKSRKVY